jgi:hypothetical protein
LDQETARLGRSERASGQIRSPLMTNDGRREATVDISTNKFADNPYPEFRENQ